MNFENAYKKVQQGTANEEEIAFISQELDKLQKISEILDNPEPSSPIREAEIREIEHARKHFNNKTTIKVIAIIFIILILIAVLVNGIIFIPSCTSAARNSRLTREECLDLAKNFIVDYTESKETNFIIKEVDRELRIPDGLNDAIFVYEIDFISRDGVDYRVEVSTKSGYVILTDINKH